LKEIGLSFDAWGLFVNLLLFYLSLLFLFSSLVSGPAVVAMPGLGDPEGPIDTDVASILTAIGDHLLAQELADAPRLRRVPSFHSRVPVHTRHMLGRAYSELYCLDSNCIVLSYLNRDSPFNYPDPKKRERAALLLATPEMVDREIDRVSRLAAIQAGRFHGLI
jgi:hypothetical protein